MRCYTCKSNFDVEFICSSLLQRDCHIKYISVLCVFQWVVISLHILCVFM